MCTVSFFKSIINTYYDTWRQSSFGPRIRSSPHRVGHILNRIKEDQNKSRVGHILNIIMVSQILKRVMVDHIIN